MDLGCPKPLQFQQTTSPVGLDTTSEADFSHLIVGVNRFDGTAGDHTHRTAGDHTHPARACPERRSCRPWGSRRGVGGVGEGDIVATSQRCTCMRDSLEFHAAPRRLVNDSRPACGPRKGSFRAKPWAKRGPWPIGEIV